MPEISVELPDAAKAELNRKLAVWESKAGNLRAPFKRFGVYMTRVTDKTFRDSGRPPGSWAPLSEWTLAARKQKGSTSKKPLVDEGDLKKSFSYQTNRKGFLFGTIDRRASVHQFGGKSTRGNNEFNIPARPMINWLPKDEKELEKIMDDYLKEGK